MYGDASWETRSLSDHNHAPGYSLGLWSDSDCVSVWHVFGKSLKSVYCISQTRWNPTRPRGSLLTVLLTFFFFHRRDVKETWEQLGESLASRRGANEIARASRFTSPPPYQWDRFSIWHRIFSTEKTTTKKQQQRDEMSSCGLTVLKNSSVENTRYARLHTDTL